MQVNIEQFRGITAATITVSPIALLAGHNGAGKSSIALGVAAAASKTAVPYAGVTKKDSGQMVRAGAKKGYATLSGPGGSNTVEWKARGDAQVLSNGDLAEASPVAVGLVDPLALKPADLMLLMVAALKATVTRDDMERALTQRGLAAEEADKVWPVVQKNGWEGADKKQREYGARLKGQWQEATGETWGEDKANGWVPGAHWDAGATEEDLQKALTAAQQTLDGLAVKAATSEAERERLTDEAGKVAQLTEDLAAAEVTAKAAAEELEKINAQVAQTPDPSKGKKTYDCPHCAKPVQVAVVGGNGDYALSVAGEGEAKLTDAQLKEARLAYAGLCGQQQNAKMRNGEAMRVVANKRAALDAAEAAATKLANLPKPEADNPAKQAQADAARAAVDTARAKLRAKQAHTRATALQADIAANLIVINLLGNEGLRREKLIKLLDGFANMYLHPTSAILGIPPVSVTADMAVVCGTTPYKMLSRSEQYRVRACLQLCIARAEQAPIVVLDDAEILVKGADRGKLLQAVMASGIPAVVCMAYKNEEGLPDLSANGQGTTYWVEAGQVREWHPATAVAA